MKDPSFVAKIKDLEDKRQDLYVSILEKRGQIVTSQDGSKTIVSYPQVKFTYTSRDNTLNMLYMNSVCYRESQKKHKKKLDHRHT